MSDNLLVQGGNFADFPGGDTGFLSGESRLEGRSVFVISEEDTSKEVGVLADKVNRFVQISPEGGVSAKTSREGTPQSIDEMVEARVLPIEIDKVRIDLSALLPVSGAELQGLVEKTDRVYQASIAYQKTLGVGESRFITGEEGLVHRGEDGSTQVLVTVGHLGQGGFGKVYKVYDANTGSISALKIFHTRGCNVKSDIEQLKSLKQWAAEVMEGKLPSIRRIAQLEEELQLTQSEVEALSRGELPETVEAKFLSFTFEKYKKLVEKAAVFQLGVALHSLLFDEMEPYRIDPKSGYQIATKAKFPEVEERIKAKFPENLELAHLLAQMVHPNPEKRPEASAIQEALKRHIEESEDLWGDVVFS